jgi:hypothetical protein
MNLSSPSLWNLLSKKCLNSSKFSKNNFKFFLSFEDALWAVLKAHSFIEKKALIPNFFCSDVTNRIKEHGFKILNYKFDSNLKVDINSIKDIINSNRIDLFILYYPLGMTKNAPNPQEIRNIVGHNTIIIEDLADCLVEAPPYGIIDSRHYCIDSLRKLLPIQGSRIWGENLANISYEFDNLYRYKSLILWFLTRLLGTISNLTKSTFIDNLRWNTFGYHSDLIGKSENGNAGFEIDRFILNIIDINAYKNIRGKIINDYIDQFSQCNFKSETNLVPIQSDDINNVRFPILRAKKGELQTLVNHLDSLGISCDIHFEDSPLSQEYDFMLMPADFNYNTKQISIILKACQNIK